MEIEEDALDKRDKVDTSKATRYRGMVEKVHVSYRPSKMENCTVSSPSCYMTAFHLNILDKADSTVRVTKIQSLVAHATLLISRSTLAVTA